MARAEGLDTFVCWRKSVVETMEVPSLPVKLWARSLSDMTPSHWSGAGSSGRQFLSSSAWQAINGFLCHSVTASKIIQNKNGKNNIKKTNVQFFQSQPKKGEVLHQSSIVNSKILHVDR